MKQPLIVYGASGHGKVLIDAAFAQGWDVIGLADQDEDKRGADVLGVSVIACSPEETVEVARKREAYVVLGIGDNATRRRILCELVAAGTEIGSIVHPSVVVARGVDIGAGTVVLAGAVLNPDAVIGRNCIVNTGATVDHDNRLGDHTHLSPGVHLGGTVHVGEGTHVGVGATVRNNITIGAWTVVGAGSVVIRDLPDRVVAYGCPARIGRSTGESS